MIGIVLSLLGIVCTLVAIWVQLCHIETVLTIIAKMTEITGSGKKDEND